MKKVIFPLILIFLIFIFAPPSLAIEETIRYEEPFVVRKLQGCIRSEGGIWPSDFANNYVFFRIYGPDGKDKVRRIKLDGKGCFKLKVPQGQYKFTIEVIGWDDAEGTIIVTPKAKKNSRILIILGFS